MVTKDPKTPDGVEPTPETPPTRVSSVLPDGESHPTTSQSLGLAECTSISGAPPSTESAPGDADAVPLQVGKSTENTVHEPSLHSSELKVVTPPNAVTAVKRTTLTTHEEDSPAKKKVKTFMLQDLDTKAKIEAAFKALHPHRNYPDSLHDLIKSVALNYTVKDMINVLKEKLGVESPKPKKKSDVAHLVADQLLSSIDPNSSAQSSKLACNGQAPPESTEAA